MVTRRKTTTRRKPATKRRTTTAKQNMVSFRISVPVKNVTSQQAASIKAAARKKFSDVKFTKM